MKKKSIQLLSYLLIAFLILSCSKDEDQVGIESIVLSATSTTVQVGNATTFNVVTNTGLDVSANASIYINDVLVNSHTFYPNTEGDYTVVAKYEHEGQTFISNVITITATAIPITAISISSTPQVIEVGQSFTFNVVANNQAQLTNEAIYFVNDVEIASNIFTPSETGSYNVKATYTYNGQLLESNVITIQVNPAVTEVVLFNEVIFYDGYAATVNQPVPDGAIRKSNASYVTKLTASQIASISNKLKIQVIIGALCDNYDRIGGVFVNMVNKNTDFSVANVQKRIEVGRFITPFMNKNISPTEVAYQFDTDNLALIFNDPEISDDYDFWIELNVFGVPYAANTQVAGCSGRNDVFKGTLKFISTDETYTHVNQLLTPIVTYSEMNNYQAGATDVIGQTTRSFNINLPSNVNNAKLYVTTSNHGANSGGEEYNRRQHFIYFDNTNIATYIPGGKSCEPYRVYNTQGNGIYGSGPKPLSYWLSFNNWCPGDIIPIRVYDLGNLTSGSHSFKIEVPTAQFVDQQGYFPISVYIQGDL